jgi:hypothetical protein
MLLHSSISIGPLVSVIFLFLLFLRPKPFRQWDFLVCNWIGASRGIRLGTKESVRVALRICLVAGGIEFLGVPKKVSGGCEDARRSVPHASIDPYCQESDDCGSGTCSEM